MTGFLLTVARWLILPSIIVAVTLHLLAPLAADLKAIAPAVGKAPSLDREIERMLGTGG